MPYAPIPNEARTVDVLMDGPAYIRYAGGANAIGTHKTLTVHTYQCASETCPHGF